LEHKGGRARLGLELAASRQLGLKRRVWIDGRSALAAEHRIDLF
jgi:hypothetical protein